MPSDRWKLEENVIHGMQLEMVVSASVLTRSGEVITVMLYNTTLVSKMVARALTMFMGQEVMFTQKE